MTDDDFLRALDTGTLPLAAFDHAAHVRAAYLYLTRFEFTDALGAMRRSVRSIARRNGKDGLYHETITVAFMTLINERIAAGETEGKDSDWPRFAASHADLFAGNPLLAFYSVERLASPLARHIFLLPDRIGATTAA